MDLVAHVVKFNSQTNGRDKLCRIFQYGSKYVWWHLEKHSFDKAQILKFKNLENALSSTRKVMRFGKSLDMIQGAIKSTQVPDLLIRATLILGKLNQAMYLLLDHYVWMTKVGLIKGDSKGWGKTAAKFWLASIIMNLIRNLYDVLTIISNEKYRSRKKEQKQGNQSLAVKCLSQNKPVAVDALKNMCDLWLPLSIIGHVDIPAGYVGLLGVCSSYIGMLCQWNPELKLTPA